MSKLGEMLYQASAKERWGIVALGVLAAGALGWYGSGYSPRAAALDADGDNEFKVHVAGAVRYPTVVTVQVGDIVSDAVDAAGGPTQEADVSLVNMAAPLLPNSRVYVPFSGEEDLAKLGPYGPGSYSVDPGVAVEQISINSANAEELDRLPGVGPTTASAILAARAARGGFFSSVEDLLQVKGIGPKTFQKLRPYVKL
jgi:competence protein ComEA